MFKKKASKQTAKNRLMAVVSRDRANISAEFLISLTSDLIETALKFVEPDLDNISVFIERKGTSTVLCSKIPVLKYREISS